MSMTNDGSLVSRDRVTVVGSPRGLPDDADHAPRQPTVSCRSGTTTTEQAFPIPLRPVLTFREG